VDDLNRRLSDREISVRLTDAAKQYVIDNAYDPIYGARPLKRFVQKHVETLSARLILEDRVAPKDVIEFDVRDGELVAEAVKA
jgi:ATP-dependent Clp protease ATP-binding subunit ClpB